MRILMIVLDGLGDRPVKRGKTPLGLARKLNMDSLARDGVCGLSDPISAGVVPGSDTGHLALFGYDPYKFYVGRGILEALGANVKVYEGDVALRANFATVDSKFNLVDRRAGRIDGKDADELAEAIKHMKIGKFDFSFFRTKGHRGVLLIRGEKTRASPLFSDVDPHSLGPISWAKPLDVSDEAKETAQAINSWLKEVNKILKNHPINKRREKEKLPPANIVIARGASSLVEGNPYKGATYFGPHVSSPVKIERFEEKYGMKAACIAGGALYKGIGRYLGMDVIEVNGATADKNTNLAAKMNAAKKALKDYDFVFLHVKGCDPAGHDGNALEKIKFIEGIDKELMKEIKTIEALVIITADHSTPVSLKNHSADPVPIVIFGPEGSVRKDNVKKFDEISVATGGLGHITHMNVMPILLGILGKAKMYGT